MHQTSENPAGEGRPTGSAFRRVGATVAVACVLTGSIMGLGAMGALATPGTSQAVVTASDSATTEPAPKVTYTEADAAVFAASPYAQDALNLAAIWQTTPEWAEGKAGAKIQAGTPLPFEPGEATTIQYTDEQQRLALQLTVEDFTELIRLATAWGSADLVDAKAEMGAVLLAHQPLPAIPTAFSDEQDALAFGLAGYGDADAVQLAGLWQTDSHSALVRAGGEILAGNDLPL
jgi:hypothetical protein